MDTKKLRQKILDLAIHGKLVSQDPNDEPASVLLDRIRAEKERLIAEGKIKRYKKSATSDTSHYENVPEGWCISTIGEVFNLQAGKNISANDIHEYSQNFPYACYGGNGIRGYVSDYNRDGKFPIIGRQGALCGNVNFAEGKFYATEHAVVVTCFAGVNVEWTRYVLEAMNLNQYATATAQPGLSVATVNEVEFMLPPLNEQCRIAEFIANCFEAIESLTTQTNDLRLNLDRAKSKILDLAIHGKLVPQDSNDEPASELLKRINPKAIASCDNPHYAEPYRLPHGWTWIELGKLAVDSADGPFGSNLKKEHYTTNNEVRIIQLSNIGENGWRDENTKYTTFEHLSEISRSEVKSGDIVIAKMMPAGRAILCPNFDLKYVLSSDAVKFVLPEGICNEYILNSINSSVFREQVYDNVQGVTRVRTSLQKLRTYVLPIPPYNEQLRIVEKVNELFSQLDMIEKSLQA